MRKRKIKFALELKDGQEARSIEELREYFDLEKVMGYLHDGKLVEWLEDRFYEDEAKAVKALDINKPDFGKKLCDILGAKYEDVEDVETIVWRKERLEKLKQYTADEDIISKIDWVAFDQEDLEDIMREENIPATVYLCQNTFSLPSGMYRREKMHYVGLGKNVKVIIRNKEPVDFTALQVVFDNIEIQEEFSTNMQCEGRVSSVETKVSKKDVLSEFVWRLFEKERQIKNVADNVKIFGIFCPVPKVIKEVFECGFLHDRSLDEVFDEFVLSERDLLKLDDDEQIICAFHSKVSERCFDVLFTEKAMLYKDFSSIKMNYGDIKKIGYKGSHIYVMTTREYDFYMPWGNDFTRKIVLFLKLVTGTSRDFDSFERQFLSMEIKALRNRRVGDCIKPDDSGE